MTSDEQLTLWLNGKPVHAEQCCPDFSCCSPELLAPVEVREIFAEAFRQRNDAVTMRMLGTFLEAAFSDKNVYIAGMETSRQEVEP